MKNNINKLRQFAFQDYILNCRNNDEAHLHSPENQIYTLSLLADALLNNNEDGQNDPLIGFYANIGRSLKQLIDYQKKERENDE